MSNKTNATNDFLDYDITESFSHFDWTELGPVIVVYSLTFCLGLIGECSSLRVGQLLCPSLSQRFSSFNAPREISPFHRAVYSNKGIIPASKISYTDGKCNLIRNRWKAIYGTPRQTSRIYYISVTILIAVLSLAGGSSRR